jgi:hypothetical protein
MPHYFFHMTGRGEQLCDENGKDLRDLSAAYDHALCVIQWLMPYLDEEDTRGWMINVATANGAAPLTVLFPRCIVGGSAGCDRNAGGW